MTLLEQLQQLAPLAAQATAGPWTHWVGSNTVYHGKAIKNKPSTYSPADLQICQTDRMDEQFEGVEAHPIDDAAFIAAARNLLTPENLTLLVAALAPQWVAAKDRLPEAGWDDRLSNPVLVYGLGTVRGVRHYEPDAEVWYDAAHGVSEPRRYYSHWMPLPASPPTTPAK